MQKHYSLKPRWTTMVPMSKGQKKGLDTLNWKGMSLQSQLKM